MKENDKDIFPEKYNDDDIYEFDTEPHTTR